MPREAYPYHIEYETMHFIDGRNIPESQLEEYRRAKAAAQKEAAAREKPREPLNCPLRHSKCREDCALYAPDGCAVLRTANASGVVQEAPRAIHSCPFYPGATICADNCAFKTGGSCALAVIANNRKETPNE